MCDNYTAVIGSLEYTEIAVAKGIFWANNMVAEFNATVQSPVLVCISALSTCEGLGEWMTDFQTA